MKEITFYKMMQKKIISNKHGTYSIFKEIDRTKDFFFLIHGYATTSKYFDDTFYEFSDKYNLIFIELPGHSIASEWYIENINIPSIADYCVNLINHLNGDKKIILLGHSMGGAISLQVANKINRKINKLILVSPLNSKVDKFRSLPIFKLFASNKEKDLYKLQTKIYKDFESFIGGNKKTHLDYEFNYILENLLFMKKMKRSLISLRNYFNISKNERIFKTPTLLFIGKHDKVVINKKPKKIFNKNNNKELFIMENSGHVCFQEEKEKFLKKLKNYLY